MMTGTGIVAYAAKRVTKRSRDTTDNALGRQLRVSYITYDYRGPRSQRRKQKFGASAHRRTPNVAKSRTMVRK
jgi:hypothetical protein